MPPPAIRLLSRRARAQVAFAFLAAMLAGALLGLGVGERLYRPAVGVVGSVACGAAAGLFFLHKVRKARREQRHATPFGRMPRTS